MTAMPARTPPGMWRSRIEVPAVIQTRGSRAGQSRRARLAAIPLGVIALAVIALSGCGGHGYGATQVSRPAATPATSARVANSHGLNPVLAECEKRSDSCGPAALKKFPLNRPVRAGTPLLTRRGVLAELGLTGAITAARRTTYRRIHAADPALAASSIIYPARVVWVVTRFFRRPVTVPQTYGPPGAATSIRVSAESVVIDAATGAMIDYCEGCAALTRAGAIVRSR
ncbi:MAG: hypothetical protein ACYCO9_05195 [Streptosporangiaceae bacterium]